MSDVKKYYWLKLQRDFFKRHDIQIIESMPNGEKYLIFYLKLLCESVDHDGRLRFSEEIPYEEEMLATITHMNIDIVRAAVTLFTNLKMMEIMDDGTYFMNQIEKMTGSMSSDAVRMKIAREKKANSLPDSDETNNVQKRSKNVHQSIELRDKSIELRDKSRDAPSLKDVEEYVLSKQLVIDPVSFIDWYENTGWTDRDGRPVKNWKNKLQGWNKREIEKRPNAKPYSKPADTKPQGNKCTCGGEISYGVCKTCGKMFDGMGNEL